MATQTPRVPTSQLFSLEGKTVVATGGTGGLGLEICIALAEAGADIVSIHLPRDPGQTTLEEGVRKLGRKVIGFECDVGDSKQLRETFDRMWKADVVPDILLNCAGLNRRGPIEDMTDDKIDLIFSVNLKGAYVAAQEFGQRLIKLGRPGKIINFGSFTSYVAMTNVSAYAATKGGVLQMTKAFSNEWACHGIQASIVSCSYT
ncbi:2-dehydro-3-deoxy-D-gluconate 5-dehydrogenase [Fonsecaea pedrosoi]|nr:2-dehydro-3-deoxy-D-gluconate 5-dehydrogenase [Fonsecaea pedrosoi]